MGGYVSPKLNEPLARFGVLRTRDPEVLWAQLSPLYAIAKLELPGRRVRFEAVLNHHNLQNVGLGYGRYGAPVQMKMMNTDFYTQGFGIRGYGEAKTEGRSFKVAGGKGGAAGPGATATLDYRANFEHVFVKISPEALNRKLSALLGNMPNRPLVLTGEYDEAALNAQYRFLRFVIAELDRSPDALPPLLLAEFDQALIVAYLCANRSNYSELLSAQPPSSAPWQVQRAIEYMEANWDQPITIEALASVTETSARSLFATFRKSRGCSPMTFARDIRLRHAREMLSKPTSQTSVTLVASQCGFRGFGNFAKRYFDRFGELPSNTLNRAKRGPASKAR